MTFRKNLVPPCSGQRTSVTNVTSVPVPHMRSQSVTFPRCQPTTFIVHDVVVAVQKVSHQLRHLAVPAT